MTGLMNSGMIRIDMTMPRPRNVSTIASASARPRTNSMVTTVSDRRIVTTSDDRAQRIVDDLGEILQADEGVAGNLEVVIDEGDPEREQQRIDRQRQDQQHRRRDQQPFEVPVGPRRNGQSDPRAATMRTAALRAVAR